ncbi:AAA family ATPase [Clostridium sp. CX1]|uniref:AAA family ATPase n=1 Tax=Clostridium sp. CX1 TaxID=2978346 RepID=UPI0021BF1A6C|nr:AAA family ATPase [Clostridium sp. CX1]MCT8976769.1 AAA family ATPase [Clostridium sp. CX1]
MDYIYVKLLGNFTTSLNGKTILFPYNKVQALFSYIVAKKQATREELSVLLWPDMEDNIARKNLRNAIYKLKKSFAEHEVISFLNKSTITLSTSIIIETDMDNFINNKNEISLYPGEFLKGFILKDADNFQQWVYETRVELEGIYLKRLYEQILVESKNKNYEKVEKYCKLLIKADEFNEDAYRQLIQCYKNQGKVNNAIKVYNELTDILNKELSITPEIETKKVFKEVLDLISERQAVEKSGDFFYGRHTELRIMESNYHSFIDNRDSKSILIRGEMGIGKTSLKNKFLEQVDKDKVYVLETNCYQFENEYPLKPWRNVVFYLARIIHNNKIKVPSIIENVINELIPEAGSDSYAENVKLESTIDMLKYDVIENILTDMLKRITTSKKILIVFEDIQWMDSSSMSLLTSCILHCQQNNIMFLITCRNEFNPYIDRFLASTRKYDKIQIAELLRFNTSETECFINQALKAHKLTKEMLNKIYIETEGNTFFITEYLNIIRSKNNINIMTSHMKDVLKSRFMDVSDSEKKIVEIASLFHDEVPMFIIKELLQKDELQIMEIIEGLEGKFILKETVTNNNICFKFTHQKLREFQYMSLSQAKKKILHNRVGQILERTLKNNIGDINTCYKLIYHFENANNYTSVLKYKIKVLSTYLNFSHELFPVIYFENKYCDKLYFSESKTIESIAEIESLLDKVRKEEGDSIQILRFEICLLHIKGRYLIRKGDYEEGIKNIEDMIIKASEINCSEYIIEGYKQMIFYCIQTNKTDEMIMYINRGLQTSEEYNYKREIGILLRFKGLYKKMLGENEEAEILFENSIDTLSSTRNTSHQYALSIAACYNYIGDIRKKTKRFSEALNFYNKAIKICEEKNVWTSLALFYANAGETAFYINNYKMAKNYFENALNNYKQFDFTWGRSIAEAFMALILIKEGNFTEGLKHLKNADINSMTLKNPKEIGTVYRVKAEIKLSMENDMNLKRVFERELDDNIDVYLRRGIKYLKEAGEEHQIDIIERL